MHGVDAALRDAITEHGIPCGSVAVRVDGHEVYHRTLGVARRDPRRAASQDQAFDLASLTKVLAAAPVTAALAAEGRFALDTPVAEHLDVDPRITVAHLLTHSSGYPAWRPLYEHPERIREAARTTPLEHAPGAAHVYSDLGFIVLLELLERFGEPFDALFDRLVLRKHGADLRWGWPGAAATEDCPVRGRVIEGEVHDLNCWALGGVSTHAGLFGTARGVAALADALMHSGELEALWALRGPGSHRGGWDSPSRDGYTSTGRFFPGDAVGHLGYTGTSLWVVPSRRTVVAFLTNRIHPVDRLDGIRAARPLVHDAVAIALGWAG